MPSHLPLLLNPLLNALFNNPEPAKSPLKDLYAKLDKSWEDGTVILVPPLQTLLNYKDRETDLPYYDLCYSEQFLNEHIITTKELSNAKLFTTYSNKEVLIKKDLLFTGKGFKKSLRLKVLKYDYFQNFSDYFEKGRKFLLMYIEAPLVGAPVESKVFELITLSSNRTETVVLQDIEYDEKKDQIEPPNAPSPSSIDTDQETFEQIIRTFPLISKSVGEKYENLFRTFNVRDVSDTDSLIQVFTQAINLSSHIFETLTPDLIDLIFQQSPNLDLNKCVYKYVEMNLYDKIWNSLCLINGDFLISIYPELEHLSLNQVSLPGKVKTDISIQSILEKHIIKAIAVFKGLTLTTDASSKIEVLESTISILSNIENITVDADTLVGLLLMVVVHSSVPDLESHLFYVQNFSYHNVDLGMTGYSLSTLEALLYFLKNEDNIETLKNHSHLNKTIFSYIDSKELLRLKRLADAHNGDPESSLKSRTLNGESILMMAIQSNDYDTWKLLIDYEEVFPLEDVLSDRTINDANLFNAALNSENFEIIDDLTDILLSSCTLEELKVYFNTPDKQKRTIGHYLFHYKDLIPQLGLFIDWTLKDMNGQTPLFAICRSYDSPNYEELIHIVFEVVEEWYALNNTDFDYGDHIDNRGNTLLHILNSNIELLLKYPKVNVNEANLRSYTPLMIYAKYNRLENIEKVLKVESLDVEKVDKNYFTSLDQSKNSGVSSLINGFYLDQRIYPSNGRQVGIVRVKLENNSWRLIIRGSYSNGKIFEALHSFTDFKTLVEIIKIEFPNSFLPLNYSLRKFDLALNIVGFNKLKLNKIVDQMNLILQGLIIDKSFDAHDQLWEFLRNPEVNDLESIQKAKIRSLKYKKSLLHIPDTHASNGDAGGSNGEVSTKEKDAYFLQPEEISEINFFLKFSLKEISKLRHSYHMLFKVVNFQSLKSKELSETYQLFSEEKDITFKDLQFLAGSMNDLAKEFKFDSDLCDNILFLSVSTDEFSTNINSLLNKKIFRWWKLYGELIELNNNYKKFKYVELKKTNKHEEIEVEGLVDLNEESFQDLTTSTSFSSQRDSSQKTKKQQPGFFSSFIESKRQKFESKLLESIKDVKQSLYELNKDIKFNHETIAMEMNNLMGFKTEFLKITLDRFVKKEIKDLRFKNVMLQRNLDNLRALE